MTGTDQARVPAHLIRPRRLLIAGTVLYFVVAIFPVALTLTGQIGGHVIGLGLTALIVISPIMALRGSEGYRTFAGVVALMLCLGSFTGSCAVADPETRTPGILSVIVFVMSCFLVNVYLINDKVKAYVAHVAKLRS